LGQEADLVVEAVGQRAVDEAAVRLMEAGCDLILLSVGALAADDPRAAVLETAERTNSTVHVPSGAVAGLDAIKAAALGGELESVSLTTRKHPTNLAAVPYFAESDVDIGDISQPQVVFAGSAREAARAFPSNINVAIALSIAGLGPEETSITIIVDPREENNVHRIEAVGEMGQIETTVRNVPFQTSTQTSYLAALSALEKLRSVDATMCVGT
jgi:aspartate dehydrogenase